jgi:hypothetical protein
MLNGHPRSSVAAVYRVNTAERERPRETKCEDIFFNIITSDKYVGNAQPRTVLLRAGQLSFVFYLGRPDDVSIGTYASVSAP